MIFDKVENLNNYEEIRPYVEQIKEFIARVEKEKLPTGVMNCLEINCLHLFSFIKPKNLMEEKWKPTKNMLICSI